MGMTRWRGGNLLPAKPSPQGKHPVGRGLAPAAREECVSGTAARRTKHQKTRIEEWITWQN